MDDDQKTIAISIDVFEMVQPGKAVRVEFVDIWGTNPNNEIRHIREIVDGDQVVYRVFGKRKRRWLYQVTDLMEFEILWQSGFLSEVK